MILFKIFSLSLLCFNINIVIGGAIVADKKKNMMDEVLQILQLPPLVSRNLPPFSVDSDAASALQELFSKCPVSEEPCDPWSRYRSYNGHCNNLRYPDEGATLTKMGRLLPPEYDDGVSAPRSRILNGGPLPNPRTVSSLIHENIETADQKHTLIVMQWGQFIDHDLALAPQYRGPGNTLLECGHCDSAFYNQGCLPILIPRQDRFFPSRAHSPPRCMKFVRSLPAPQSWGPREQLNAVSHYLDGSMVYGSDACHAAEIREPNSYLMKMTHNPRSSSARPMKDLLPLTPHNPECRAADSQCFMAGDERVNEQPGLTVMHTMFVREHNNIASHLASINQHWSDERVFQETRRIIIAMIQHITYNEFLPRVLGDVFTLPFKLSLDQSVNNNYKYNPECGGTIYNEFATAAFRFGHSLIKSNLSLLSEENMESGGPLLQVPLRSVFNNPEKIRSGLVLDSLVRGLVMVPMETNDNRITEEVANHLFEMKKKKFSGLDLAALNIHRGRDHGLAGYNKFREMCGLKRAVQWRDLDQEIPVAWIEKLQSAYDDPDDVDLFPGMLVERKLEGGIVGPTLGCILATQFNNLRQCDRFWYETDDPLLRFSPAQLQEIRSVRLSALLCRNCDQPGKMPLNVFDMMEHGDNHMMQCEDMKHLNLELWRTASHHQKFDRFFRRSVN